MDVRFSPHSNKMVVYACGNKSIQSDLAVEGSFDTQMWLLKRHTDDMLGQKAVILTLGDLASHIFFHSPYFFPPPRGGGKRENIDP